MGVLSCLLAHPLPAFLTKIFKLGRTDLVLAFPNQLLFFCIVATAPAKKGGTHLDPDRTASGRGQPRVDTHRWTAGRRGPPARSRPDPRPLETGAARSPTCPESLRQRHFWHPAGRARPCAMRCDAPRPPQAKTPTYTACLSSPSLRVGVANVDS